MQDTPKGLRLHIGLFGKRNSGKSTLMNALIGQSVSIVSAHPGTTTDPVEKAYELAPLGAVVFIDTAGLDDVGELGALRVERTRGVLERVDLALIVVDDGRVGTLEQGLIATLREQKTPFVVVFNKSDIAEPGKAQLMDLAADNVESVAICAARGSGIDALKEAMLRQAPEGGVDDARLIGDLIGPGDVVILVVPIDLGAPKGRLILPQVQTLATSSTATRSPDGQRARTARGARAPRHAAALVCAIPGRAQGGCRHAARDSAHYLFDPDGPLQGRHDRAGRRRRCHSRLSLRRRADLGSLFAPRACRRHRARENSALAAPVRRRQSGDRREVWPRLP
jgi:small GTP-binding protein